VDGGKVRDLDYETDLLAAIDWRGYDPAGVVKVIPENAQEAVSQLQVISLAGDGHGIEVGKPVAFSGEAMRLDPAYAVRAISDLVPNPFVAREIVGRLLTGLSGRGFGAEKIGRLASLILNELRKALDLERNARAEVLFRAEVLAGRIQFRLRLDGANWRMPFAVETSLPVGSRVLAGKDGTPVGKSVFAPFYEADLNTDERGVAVMLDGDGAIQWWHRNVALSGYGLQGWKRGRIYPDFIFLAGGTGAARRIVALETKGDHLQNPDTDYKRDLLDFLSQSFAWDTAVPAGELQLQQTGETVECTLILMQDVKRRLPPFLAVRA